MWERDGVLVVRRALGAADAERLARAIIEKSIEARVAHSPLVGDAGNSRDINLIDAHCALSELLSLVDCSPVFRAVLGIMGPRIQVGGIETLCRYPSEQMNLPLHTDGGSSLRSITLSTGRPIQIKAQIILTDTTIPGSGAFTYVPGSQWYLLEPEQLSSATARSVDLLLEAGDAVIFPWSLWHGASRKTSETPRVSVVIRYTQLWARQAFSSMERHRAIERQSLSERRRLLLFPEERNPRDSGECYYKWDDASLLATMFGQEWSDSLDRLACTAALTRGSRVYRSAATS